MAKYIDLLRAHQNDPAKPPASTAQEQEIEAQYEELETMLDVLDEDDMSPSSMSEGEDIFPEDLPSEADEHIQQPPKSEPSPTPETELTNWLNKILALLHALFQQARSLQKGDIQPLSNHISELLERLEKDDTLLNDLELDIARRVLHIREQDPDLGNLVQKSLLMMLYAIKMSRRLHLQMAAVHAHVLAAMLHHIGMAQVSSAIRNKKERLTEPEMEEIRKASARAHDYLSACGITDPVILQAASQANERFDGSGPQGLSTTDISYSARMIGLLSMFEALIHFRPYRHRLLPRDAIRELVNHHKKEFDPIMLKALIESISLYPVGTYIQLNTGEVGLVTQVNDRLPLRPVVAINMDSRGGEIPQRIINLKEQPNLMIQHCMYEEGLAELKNRPEKQRRR